jgi:hypothetical protein
MTLAIAHRDSKGNAILDAVRERRPPFNPDGVAEEFAELLKTYGLTKVTGDRYGGEWPRERFRAHGITYELSEGSASDIYREFLPLVNGGRIELLDLQRLHAQLCDLERKTSRTGKDTISHPPQGHDDIANAVAGVLGMTAKKARAMVVSEEALRKSTMPVRAYDLQYGRFSR